MKHIVTLLFMSILSIFAKAEYVPIINHNFKNGNIWVEIPSGFEVRSITPAHTPEIYDMYSNGSKILIYEYNSTTGSSKIEERDLTILRNDSIIDGDDKIWYREYKSNSNPEIIYRLEKKINDKTFSMILVSDKTDDLETAIDIFKKSSWHSIIYALWEEYLKGGVISLLILLFFGAGGARLWNKDLPNYFYLFLAGGPILLSYLYLDSGFSNLFIFNIVICISALFSTKFKIADFLFENFS